jgi:PAS domain S-box-containing protein
MGSGRLAFFQIVKGKEILLFLVLFIAGLSLLGWLLDEIVFASISLEFIPIAPSTALLFFILSSLLVICYNFRKAPIVQLVTTSAVLLVALFCLLILADYIFDFPWDIENVFIVNPQEFGGVLIGRMSPITSLLFFFTCIGTLADVQGRPNIVRYIGGSFSLLTCFVAIVLLIGYLYNAPLLYGSQIIPVALPTAICFLLFGITLLRMSELKYWTFNLLKNNPTKFLLLKTFLPLVIFFVVLQGFIETNFSVVHNNPTLSSALVILVIVALTIFIVIRASAFLGDKLMKTENLLRESENKYRTLIENSGEGIGFVNTDEQFVFANKAAEGIFGVGPGGLIGMSLDQFVSDEQYALVQKETTQRIQGNISVYELDIMRPNGEKRTILITAVPQHNKEGAFSGTYGVFRDISERKQAEAEIKLKNEELSKSNAEKDKFFSIIAHDLRSPFNGFLGLTEIMAEELPDLTNDEIQKIAVSMRDSAANLFRLLENLLEWAKMQRGLIPFEPKQVVLPPIVDECITLMLESAKNKGITIIKNIPKDIEVFADSNILQTVIRNLVSNALKFTPKGGEVSLSAKDTGHKTIEISVGDTGIGMSKEMIENLFRPDVMTKREGTDGEPSSGLGLLICKEFVEKNGGELWVESDPEGQSGRRGSIFYFTIPLS